MKKVETKYEILAISVTSVYPFTYAWARDLREVKTICRPMQDSHPTKIHSIVKTVTTDVTDDVMRGISP